MRDELKISTFADVLRDPTPEEKKQHEREEAAFRRGFFDGVDATIEATRAGVNLRRLIDYYNGVLWSWRFSDCNHLVRPPEMPKAKGEQSLSKTGFDKDRTYDTSPEFNQKA